MRASALAAVVLLAAAAPRAAARGSVTFALDPRVEALSVVLMLAEPAEFRARRPAGLESYAAAAAAAFERHAGHPAVARVRDLRRGGATPAELARAALAPDGGLARDLADFERASGFAEFLASHGEDHRAFVDTARRESLHAISPESALAYMGLPFEGERRFLLAPLLPGDDDGVEPRLRAGTPTGGATRFQFDAFERSAAFVLSREAASWFREPAGDVPAHVAAAVGLRVLALDLGERVYAAVLRRGAMERFPRVKGVAERLKDYERERGRYKTLRAFSPRLEALAALRADQAALAARGGGRDAALALLDEARAQGPDVETARRIVFLYQDLKEDRRARAAADELLEAAPGHSGVLLDRARLAAETGDRAAAVGFLAAAARGAAGADDRRRMAELYLELKEYGAAGALLDGLIADAPRDPRLLVDRALAAARTGDRAAARRALAAAASRRPDAGLSRRMALLHLELEDHGAARSLLDRLVEENPGDATLRVDQAAAAAAAGERAEALRRLAGARALSPAPETRRRMAFLYQELGENGPARDLLKELPGDAPADARSGVDLAARAARDGERGAALELLAAARALNPSFEERRLMVSLYQELDAPGPAGELLAGLVAAAPRDPAPRIDRAALAARTGDRAGALAALAEARKLGPDPGGRRRMALIHQDVKDYAGALALLEPLAREQPANAALLGDLGLCRYLDGKTDAAIADLRAAVALDPSALPALLTLGSIYAAQGLPDRELALYDAAPRAGGEPALRALLDARRGELLRAMKRPARSP